MKRLIIIFFFICTPLYAEKIERLGFYNLQEILEDDTLTYKIIKGCVSFLVLIPMTPSHVDFWATEAIIDIAKKANKKIMIQINRANQRSKLIIKTNEYIKSLNVPSVNTIIGNRQIYASSIGEGKTAIEKQRKGTATEEIKKLSEQILSELN